MLYRKHVVGRLSAHLPPHVLKMFARATVLGKLRTYLHLALKVRLSENDPHTVWGKKLQVIVNDVTRVINKKRRSDHVRVQDLLKKAGLEGVNSMVCSNSAMMSWRASKPDNPSTVSSKACSRLEAQGGVRGAQLQCLIRTAAGTKSLAWRQSAVQKKLTKCHALHSVLLRTRVLIDQNKCAVYGLKA